MSNTKIVNLRGTSGSGKSTVVFTLMKNFETQPLSGKDGKIKGYVVDASEVGITKPIYVIGRYTTACGGLDTVPTQVDAAERAVAAYNLGGHVLCEGLLCSAAGPKGALTIALQNTGAAVFAIMDTPLEKCIERVQERRKIRGDERPLNTKNTRDKWTQTMSTAKSLSALGYNVVSVNHENAYEDVLNIFRQAEARS